MAGPFNSGDAIINNHFYVSFESKLFILLGLTY